MPNFVYTAINENGSQVEGTIEAENEKTATAILVNRGLIPSKVVLESQFASRFSMNRLMDLVAPVRAPELILFTKQFKTLIKAGVPILNLLQVLETQTENESLKKIIVIIRQDIREGSSLYDAFKKHPRVFSSLYCSMLRAGESSGALPEILERLIYIIEHEHKVRSDIRAALQYPAVVFSFLVLAFFILLTFVIPKFVNIFVSSGLELPLPTLVCLKLYNFISHYWFVLIVGSAALIAALLYYFRTEKGRLMRDTILLRIPILGPLLIKAAMSRFASIFAILQSSGVPVLESMGILSGTINNAAIAAEFSQITERLEEGRGIAGPLKAARYFTPIVINMVAIGEESGNLDEMLNEIAIHYDSEMEYAMKKLSDAIGPLLTLGLAAVIGFFALAIYLPMWNLTQMVR